MQPNPAPHHNYRALPQPIGESTGSAFLSFNLWRVATLVLALILSLSTTRADTVVAWGNNDFSQGTVPVDLGQVLAVSAGGGHNTAILPDRTVDSWGYNPFGQLDVPPGLSEVIAVAAGYDHSLALRSDGTVVSWGRNTEGQSTVPAGLNGVVAVSANGYHSLALKSDGTVVAWGDNTYGQGNIPSGLANVTAISSGPYHNLALRRDGTVVAWGRNDIGQSTVPPGLAGVVEIAAGGDHSLVRKADGTLSAWGLNTYDQANVTGIDNVIALAAGYAHSLFLRADGSVVARGWNDNGQATVPPGLTHVRAISAGFFHSVALVGDEVVPPPSIACPPNANLACAACDTDPTNTGTATATGQGQLRITYRDAVTGDCPKEVKRTWTVQDDSGQTDSCVQTITCRGESSAIVITCPPDRILLCEDCNTDPANTGVAAATGGSSVQISYRDVVRGDCPKVVTRTWMATDGVTNTHCVQKITCVPASVLTTSSFCTFDRDPATAVQDFRLIFTQDPQNWPCFRLTSSNPGGFAYNIFQTGTPGEQMTFNVTVPYPFVTRGTSAIRAYDWVHAEPGSHDCYDPGAGFYSSTRAITLGSYGKVPSAAVTVPITLTVPNSGVVFLSINLDYGLKKHTGFTRNLTLDAVDCATGLETLIPNEGVSSFAVSGAQDDAVAAQNQNTFKKNPGVGGLIRDKNSGDPVPGTLVTLTTAKGAIIGTRTTDEDGFFYIAYKHTGKAAVYSVSILTPSGYRATKAITLKSNRYVMVEFLTP